MNRFIPDTLHPDETTASAIVRRFAANGIRRDDISSEDLLPVYRELCTTKAVAGDFSNRFGLKPSEITQKDDSTHAVIVETREHPLLEYVVCQFAAKLDVGIQVFHSPRNRQFITDSKVGDLIEAGQVQLTELPVNEFSQPDYNGLLLSPFFWLSLTGRGEILIFQTDSILCEKSVHSLNDFKSFDYIGSSWDRNRPVGMVIEGGSGGLSLRDWHLTVECLERFPPHEWPGGEDGYFAFHLDIMGAKVAREEDCGKFSTQSQFVSPSFGAHQIQNLHQEDLKRFLEYCPEARVLL